MEISSSFELVLDAIREAAPYGWVMAPLGVVGVTAALLALVWHFLRRERPAEIASRVAVTCVVAIAVVGFVALTHGRTLLAEGALGLSVDDHKVMLLSRGISLQMNAGAMAMIGVTSVLQLLALAWVVGAVRRVEGAREFVVPSLLARGAMLVPVYLAARAALTYELSIIHGFVSLSAAPPSSKSGLMLAIFATAQAALDEARLQVFGAIAGGVLASIIAATLATRRGLHFNRRWQAGAAILFITGLASYGLTRHQAVDARHPMPDDNSDALPLQQIQRAPLTEHCRVAPRVPVIDVAPDHLTLDGLDVKPEELKERLDILRKNYGVLHPDEPPPPDAALILADPATPIATLRPWLNQTLYWIPSARWLLAEKHPRVALTRTLGTIDRTQTCGQPFDVALSATYSPATWGELAKRLESANEVVHLSP